MTNDSVKLAQLWIDLRNMKNKLDNEILPISGHLGLDDPELMIAMEELSEKISSHFEKFKLVAETRKISRQTTS
jgi:hypothetical protein